MGDAADRLREFRARMNAPQPQDQNAPRVPEPNMYPGILPQEMYAPAAPRMDPEDEQIEKYLAEPLIILESDIPEKFKQLGDITADMRPVSKDFYDNKMLRTTGISMDEKNSGELCALGRFIIPMISSGFSRQGAASLFVLAANVTTPGTDYTKKLFPEIAELNWITDRRYTEFSVHAMINQGAHEPLQGGGNEEIEASIYSFLALCLMRLFTKSAENMVKAWSHIQKGFNKFYGDAIEIFIPDPNVEVMKNLAEWFSMEPRAKQSLYRLLYTSNANTYHRGFKRFTFEMHLLNTGLHAVNFYASLCKQLNCSTGILLRLLNVQEYSVQVDCLVELLKLLTSTDAHHSRGMWRFGRIFDETFMSPLQTKSCVKLVYILGEALRMVAPKTYANFDNISQLGGISDVNKKECKAIARNLISTIRNHSNLLSLRPAFPSSSSHGRTNEEGFPEAAKGVPFFKEVW